MNCLISLKEIQKPGKHPGYLDGSYKRLFGSLNVEPVLSFDRKDFMTEIAQTYTKRMSISGVQQKLSLKVADNQLVPTETAGRYILKPSPERYPEASENEHLTMLIGAHFGIETPPCGLIRFSDGEPAYIVMRFDRVAERKLHQLDMSAAFELQRDKEGRYKHEKSYEEVAVKIREVCGGKLAPVRDFFFRLLKTFLVADGDHHLKNISVLMSAPNRVGSYDGLSPQYDSLNTRPYFPDEDVFALDFLANDDYTPEYEKLGFYTRFDFGELGRRIDLTDRAIDSVYHSVKERYAGVHDLVDASHLSVTMKTQYRKIVAERYKMLFETDSPLGPANAQNEDAE
jgi:serine/threonine-protein kinase HipA